MHRSRPRHARRGSAGRAARRAVLALTAVAGLSATLLVVPPTTTAAAAGEDPCLKPQLSDVMVNQGLPSYAKLAQGKRTLVRYFLRLPNCAPEGATVTITGGKLLVGSGQSVVLDPATLPLPPIGLAASSPIPSAASDPMFVVPGHLVVPDATGAITFVAELQYTATPTGCTTPPCSVELKNLPGTTTPVRVAVQQQVNPLRVLVVPMGDAGTARRPVDASTQFTSEARSGVQAGMLAAARMLPVPDSAGEDLRSPIRGLRYDINAGLLNLGEHVEDGLTRNYFTEGEGSFCGRGSHLGYISRELQRFRTAWNSVNAGQADLALGQVWQGVSRGPSTHPDSPCAEGYAGVPGRESWGRVVPATTARPGLTGAVATMEVLHNLGLVTGDRNDGNFHSKNVQADGTAPERAWNTSTLQWLPEDRSEMHFTATGWHDGNTVLEKGDWEAVQCTLLPAGSSSTACTSPGVLGVSAAGAQTDLGSFFLSGSTDGTRLGTDAHTYFDDGRTYDLPVGTSEYRFVQRSATGAIVGNDGFTVSAAHDSHHAGDLEADDKHVGTFGTQFEAHPSTTRIQLYKGDPQVLGDPEQVPTSTAVLLHERQQNAAPTFVSVSATGRSLSVSALDELPEQLRLDLFYACPDATHPLAVAVRPTVTDRLATFLVPYDTSLGCPQGTLTARITDGFETATRQDILAARGQLLGSAAIYSPSPDTVVTQFEPVALSGSGRDAIDSPATKLVWTLQGDATSTYPTETQVAEGPAPTVVRSDGLKPGRYTVGLRAFGPGGAELARTTSSLVVKPDRDEDEIPDDDDRYCTTPPRSAADDPRNATLDSDRDGRADVVDAAPCQSSLLLSARFTPESLQRNSSGVPVTVEISNPPPGVDLRDLQTDEVAIVQVAGYPTVLPALAYRPSSASAATAKFDRSALTAVFGTGDLLGYVRVFVGTTDGRLRGADDSFPRVFP